MPDAAAMIRVQLVGLPLQTRRRYMAYTDDLLRELELVRIGSPRADPGRSPRRLAELVNFLVTSYSSFMAAPSATLVEAEAAGATTYDVSYVVPWGARPFVAELGGRLAEAEDYCRSGRYLLTLPPPPELSAYRQWVFGEFVGQLDGAPPRPWAHIAPTGTTNVGSGRHWDGGEELVHDARFDRTRHDAAHAQDHGEPLFQRRLDPTPVAPRHARGFVVESLVALGASRSLQDAAALGTSELVTNAVLHARTVIAVSVDVAGASTVRISVSDSSDLPVVVHDHGATAATGRGLHLVQTLASGFGIDRLGAAHGPGKRVWFELVEPARSFSARRSSTSHR